jgi:hypothetical protein
MKNVMLLGALLLVTAAVGCNESTDKEEGGSPLAMFQKSGPEIPAGTAIDVRLGSDISSETAKVGDGWAGVTTGDIVAGGEVIVPSGSSVSGRVSGTLEAQKGNRALLDLEVTSISIDGKGEDLLANTEPVIAGSPRARNLGAIAGGAAAGALLGKAIGGDGSDAAKGAVIGGAAATVGVAASRGYQVVLKSGTVLSFTVQ